MLEGRDQFFELGSFLIETAFLDFLLKKSVGFFELLQENFVGCDVLFANVGSFFPELVTGLRKLGLAIVECEPGRDGLEGFLGELLSFDGLDEIRDVVSLQLLHVGDESSLLDLPIDAERLGELFHLLIEGGARFGE